MFGWLLKLLLKEEACPESRVAQRRAPASSISGCARDCLGVPAFREGTVNAYAFIKAVHTVNPEQRQEGNVLR